MDSFPNYKMAELERQVTSFFHEFGENHIVSYITVQVTLVDMSSDGDEWTYIYHLEIKDDYDVHSAFFSYVRLNCKCKKCR